MLTVVAITARSHRIEAFNNGSRLTNSESNAPIGGATSIDVTKHGIDKAYGIKKLQETLGISVKEMIYVGDALFVGGNDYPAEQTGVISIPVRGPNETKRVIEAIIACLDDGQQARTFKVASAIL
jgi:hydroxymethylpyrimidine pyrophosphatase-like HAD family hydrolase